MLENDPFALDAESRSRFDEGTFVSLSGHTHSQPNGWRLPTVASSFVSEAAETTRRRDGEPRTQGPCKPTTISL